MRPRDQENDVPSLIAAIRAEIIEAAGRAANRLQNGARAGRTRRNQAVGKLEDVLVAAAKRHPDPVGRREALRTLAGPVGPPKTGRAGARVSLPLIDRVPAPLVDIGDLQVPVLPDLGDPATFLDLRIDRVTCHETTRFEGKKDEVSVGVILFLPGGSTQSIEPRLYEMRAGDQVEVGLAHSIGLADHPPFQTFGALVTISELNRGTEVDGAEFAKEAQSVVAALVALMIGAAIGARIETSALLLIVAGLIELIVLIVLLATGVNVILAHQTSFTVRPPPLASPGTAQASSVEAKAKGGHYSLQLRWALR